MKEPLSSVILYTDFIFGVTTMKNKLFGKNIIPDCAYCDNAFFENGIFGCKKSRHIQNSKCRAFNYNPLLRVPTKVSLYGNDTAEDFKL